MEREAEITADQTIYSGTEVLRRHRGRTQTVERGHDHNLSRSPSLAGGTVSLGVLLIDQDNNERTLQPGEVVKLEPGLGFSKKVRFRRG